MTLSRNTRLERGEPLRATKWGTRKKPPKASWRDEFMPDRMAPEAPKYTAFELSWFAYVRTLPCCAAHLGRCWGPMAAAHLTLSADQKGTSMKVPHDQTGPMCTRHHDFWDGRSGRKGNPFDGWSREKRYGFASACLEIVHEAATPGDDRAHADELERLGLGNVIGNGRDGWNWLPGHLVEVEPAALGSVAP